MSVREYVEELEEMSPFDVMSSGMYFIKTNSVNGTPLSAFELYRDLTDRLVDNIDRRSLIESIMKLISWFAINRVIVVTDGESALNDFIYGEVITTSGMENIHFVLHPFWIQNSCEIKDLVSCNYRGDHLGYVIGEWLLFQNGLKEEYKTYFPNCDNYSPPQ